jgi:ribosomal protein S18 acetylase RimI-like enzyme
MNGDRQVTLRPAEDDQTSHFFGLMLQESRAYLPQTLQAMGMTEEQFERAFRTVGEIRAISVEEQVAGFCWTEVREGVLHIHALVMEPDYQSRGIGSEVMRMLEDEASRAADTIEVGIHSSNARALRMCKRLGFEQTSDLPDLGFIILQKSLAG